MRFAFAIAACAAAVLAIADGNASLNAQMSEVEEQLKKIDKKLDAANSVWIKRFDDQRDYLARQTELAQNAAEIKQLANKRDAASKQRRAYLEERSKTLKTQIDLLGGETGSAPYENLTKTDPLPDPPEVRNPFAIVTGLTYLNDGERILKEQRIRLDGLKTTIDAVKEKQALLERKDNIASALGAAIDPAPYAATIALLASLNNSEEVFATAIGVLENRFASNRSQVRAQIDEEVSKLVSIVIVIAVIFALGFLLKLVARRTVKDANRLFSLNRAVNIAVFLIIVLILLFNYISNIVYFVTLLGFISAGIAIAMKDWFMSLLGWLVIVVGGSVHIGDRIRLVRDGGDIVVGDVLEIGLTRIMMFEDITLATFEVNRRAGRIIHIPNNFIFSHIVQNYTYNGMQTVWDGVDIVITFSSNHKKAVKIAKEIAVKHAVGYTDQTRKHYNNLRMRFNLRTVSVEPRVFAIPCAYGVKVSVWYLTNSYATLSLRTVIGCETIDAFNAADGIAIAYPTYAIGGEARGFEPPIAPDQLPTDMIGGGFGGAGKA